MNREASKKKITQQSFLAVFTALCLSAWFGILNVLASSSIELMDVFDFFPFFFQLRKYILWQCCLVFLFFDFCYFLSRLPCWWKPGFGFSTRSSLEWMLCFTDNFQLFHSNKKFIKMTCSPGKEFATDFFSMILQVIVFSFPTMFTC